ncbi:DEAD/DEAH box helicase family protein [Patescibacteria group bacterium]
MENALLQAIQNKIASWRDENYKGAKKETLNILKHIKRIGYLHKPQLEALETYIYLKEILNNKPTVEVAKTIFDDELELIKSLGISEKQALELAYAPDKKKRIEKLLHARYNGLDYTNHVYALTMGAGKTILMGTMILYDFTLSFYHPKDKCFAKNALVFAPDKTIIESLKEIKTFDYTKVLPKEYQNILLNIKYHYLENTDTPLEPIGNYNIIVSNSQKIILKTRHKKNPQTGLFRDANYLKKREIENRRLQTIRQIEGLMIVVDEAHHSFGTTLEGKLKKTKATINYIHKEGKTPLVASINLTGTPYIKNKMIADVVYYFGLKQGIEKGVLKQVRFFEYGNVKSESFVEDIVNKFTNEYQNRLEGKLPKIAFYASNISDLQQNLKPTLERVLAKKRHFEKFNY